MIVKEACIGSVEEGIYAQKKGANRVELCSHLELDGLTPNIKDTISLIKKAPGLPIMVMIRDKPGNFYYNY